MYVCNVYRFNTFWDLSQSSFFYYSVMCTCPQSTKILTALSRIHLMGKNKGNSAKRRQWTKKYSLQHREHYVWRHFLSVRVCLLKLKPLMTLALWLNRWKSSTMVFTASFPVHGAVVNFFLIAANLSAYSSSIKNLICTVHIGITLYDPISGLFTSESLGGSICSDMLHARPMKAVSFRIIILALCFQSIYVFDFCIATFTFWYMLYYFIAYTEIIITRRQRHPQVVFRLVLSANCRYTVAKNC